MKKIILFLSVICILVSCKTERLLPDNYEMIEENFDNGNYGTVIELLNDPDITHKEKTDWYYFIYGASLYKKGQIHSQDALRYLKIANAYNDEDFNITYCLGEVFFDTRNYKKASDCFEKCIKGNLKGANFINSNPVLWLLLSKLKLDVLNLNEFVKLYGTSESEEFERFAEILADKTLKTDDVLYYIQSDALSDREKLLVIDALIDIEQNKKQLLEILYHLDVPKLFKEYFGSRLIYYKLENLDECFDLIKELNISGVDSFIILSCNEYMVWEYFEKYCAFYYWLTKDYHKVNVSAQSYHYIKKRVSSYSIKSSADLKLFYKEFKEDSEFTKIIK